MPLFLNDTAMTSMFEVVSPRTKNETNIVSAASSKARRNMHEKRKKGGGEDTKEWTTACWICCLYRFEEYPM